MARGMVKVELVDDEPPAGGPGPDPVTEWLRRAASSVGSPLLRAWRRPWVRWAAAGVAVTLVAVTVVVRVVDSARERARQAALAQVPGIVRPLHPGLQTLMRVADPDSQALTRGSVVGGSLVSVVSAQDGNWSVDGLDSATGARRWSTVLEPVGALADQVEPASCAPAGAVELCTAMQVADAATYDWKTSTWVLDPADGHVIRAAAYDEHTWAVAADGLIVMAHQSSGPSRAPAAGPWSVTWEVTGSDPSTGAVRWTWASPPVAVHGQNAWRSLSHDPTDYNSSLAGFATPWVAARDVVLAVGDDTWVLGAGGSLLTHIARPGGWSVSEENGSLLRSPLVPSAEGAIAAPVADLLVGDGSWRPIPGDGQWLTVNDGSAPAVLVRTSGGPLANGLPVLSGVDRNTGKTLWQTQLGSGVGFMALVAGRLYVGTRTLQAIDVATGRVVWSTPADDPGGQLVATDGTVLLVRSHGSPERIEARSMRDGRVLWRQDVSALSSVQGGVRGIGTLPALRRLAAVRQDESVVVLG